MISRCDAIRAVALTGGTPHIIPRAGVTTASMRSTKDMSLATALKTAIKTIPDCLAVGYIDMDNGMLLDAQFSDGSHEDEQQAMLDVLAIAISNLFDGDGVMRVQAMLSQANGSDAEEEFSEIVIYSDDYLYVFQRSREISSHAVCYVCRESANPGLVLTKSQLSLSAISAAV